MGAMFTQDGDEIPITAKYFVAAFADENHSDTVLFRRLRDKVHRQARGIADRFVLVVDQLREASAAVIRGDGDFLMIAAKLAGHPTGIWQVVKVLGLTESLKSNRKCAERFGGQPAHQRHIGAGIDSATEKGADRKVAHKPLFDSPSEQLTDAFDTIVVVDLFSPSRRIQRRPVPLRPGRAIGIADHPMRGRKFANVAEESVWRRRIREGKEVAQASMSRSRTMPGYCSSALTSDAKRSLPPESV